MEGEMLLQNSLRLYLIIFKNKINSFYKVFFINEKITNLSFRISCLVDLIKIFILYSTEFGFCLKTSTFRKIISSGRFLFLSGRLLLNCFRTFKF